MKYANHVILGAGGAITQALVPELLRNKQEVTLLSRKGTEIAGTSGVSADVTDFEALKRGVPENSVVYLLVGLPYDSRVWSEQWPQIMENVIAVCMERGALLVFFDNVYMYGKVDGPMTEGTPHRPVSKKGEIRARIAEQLQREYESGALQAIIARSADFYGPGAERTGIPNLLIIEKLLKGSKAQWLADADKAHSLTYTNDCGRALYLLVGEERAYNQVWHLPTARPALTARQLTEIAAEELGVQPRISALSPWMVAAGGLFDRTIKELSEMLYQNKEEYIFDSSKFEEHFSFTPTSYKQGIEETINYYRQQQSE
jgi:nucleoside-diphosphate-sugar epimerase